jgi:hypothetical protein
MPWRKRHHHATGSPCTKTDEQELLQPGIVRIGDDELRRNLAELEEIANRYKRMAGFDKDAFNECASLSALAVS